MLSLAGSLVAQVVAVRFFSKSDYGAFAYGLSVAALGGTLSVMGLDKAAARFIPIYAERKDHAKLFGALALMAFVMALIGVAVVVTVVGVEGMVVPSLE